MTAPFTCQFFLHTRHGAGEVARFARPSRRMDAGRAVKRLDRKAGIVRKCGLAGGKRRDDGFELSVLRESLAGFDRLRYAKLARGKHANAVRFEKLADFAQLSLIVRGDDEAVPAVEACRHCQLKEPSVSAG